MADTLSLDSRIQLAKSELSGLRHDKASDCRLVIEKINSSKKIVDDLTARLQKEQQHLAALVFRLDNLDTLLDEKQKELEALLDQRKGIVVKDKLSAIEELRAKIKALEAEVAEGGK